MPTASYLIPWLRQPFVLPVLWMLLHSLDYFLTVAGEKARRRRAAEIIQIEGSYELNPLFQKDIDAQKKVSKRFLTTLITMAVMLFVITWITPSTGTLLDPLVDVLVGVLIGTRVLLILRHLTNISIFTAVAEQPELLTGQVRYARRLIIRQTAWAGAGPTALLLIAFAATPSAFVLGMAFGCAVMSLIPFMWARRQAKAGVPRAVAPAPAPPAAAPAPAPAPSSSENRAS